MRMPSLALSFALLAATPALARPPAAKKPAAKPAAAAGAAAAPCSADALLRGLRSELVAARRAGKPSDLAGLMMNSVVEGAFATLLHSVYALGAAGHAMQKGGMSADDTAVVARDMGRNLGALAATWSALAKQQALAGPPAQLFRELARIAGDGVGAAKALETFAKHPNATTQAGAFSDSLERWRQGVGDLAKALRGPEPAEQGPETSRPALPAP